MVFVDVRDPTAPGTAAQNARSDAELARLITIVEGYAAEHGGRVVEHPEDGPVRSFWSARAAVEFAVAVQRQFQAAGDGGDLPPPPRVGIAANEVPVAGDGGRPGLEGGVTAKLIAAQGAGRDILVSNVVRGLVGHRPGIEFVEVDPQQPAG
ncbi:MAG: hypothetical protein OEY70_18510, partial [Acidimicrobiia bacterium]|nr:hypothetical protein [Acidimicrobiia bacterium]